MPTQDKPKNEPERKPYSKYWGQGDPEWRCPGCGRFIPDEQDKLECLHCKADSEHPAPEPDKKEPMILHLQLKRLQRVLEMAVGRPVPLPKLRQVLNQLSEPGDDLPSERQ